VLREARTTAPCPLPVVFQGTFTAKAGKRHHVEASIEHAGDLSNWKPGDKPQRLSLCRSLTRRRSP